MAASDYNFPFLQEHPTSGLSFPWAEFVSKSGSTFDMSMGHQEGTSLGMCMLIDYDDLETAIPQLLGYSYRTLSTELHTGPGVSPPFPSVLHRILPFRHPRWSQLWCTKIVKVQGLRFTGKDEFHVSAIDSQIGGPVATYQNLLLTLQFSRPNYAVLSDDDIKVDGVQDETKRYIYRQWQPNTQMLSREGMTFEFAEGAAIGGDPASPNAFPGSVGVPVSKIKLTIDWYQIPKAAIFDLNFFPFKLYYGAQGVITNVVSASGSPGGLCRITCKDHGFVTGQTVFISGVIGTDLTNVVNGITEVTVIDANTFDSGEFFSASASYASGGLCSPFLLGSVNIYDFMGCPAGTLLYEQPEIITKPLPMPPVLMQIVGEEIQNQFDIRFHFTFFDPPPGDATRGHNCMPWSADGLWYLAKSRGKLGVAGRRRAFALTPFSQLFQIL